MTSKANKRRTLVGVLAAAGMVLVLAGCSSSPSTNAGANGGSSTTTSSGGGQGAGGSTGTTTGSSVSTTVPQGTTIPYNPLLNARQDVTIVSPCTQSSGSWLAHGTVHNSSSKARGYQIVVDFVDHSDTVLDTKIVTVPTVAPNASTTWQTVGAPGQSSVSCVIRQVQVQL